MVRHGGAKEASSCLSDCTSHETSAQHASQFSSPIVSIRSEGRAQLASDQVDLRRNGVS